MDAPYEVDVTIDRSSDVPLYQQIAEPLERAITNGEVMPGQLIEDEISMARRLEVSRPTTRRAFQELVNRGLLTRRRGVGTRVTPSQVHRPLELTSLNEDLRNAGYKPSTRVISYEIMEADAEQARALELEEGAGVLLVHRLRLVNNQPLAVLVNQIPLDVAPKWADLQTYGLYECFARQGARPVTASQVIGARAATEEEAQILQISAGDPLLIMDRVSYDESGRAVEVAHHLYRPSDYSFSFTVFAS